MYQNERISKILMHNPDLPVIVKSDGQSGEYVGGSYGYVHAEVRDLLFVGDVELMCNQSFGLSGKMAYDDRAEVAENIENWLVHTSPSDSPEWRKDELAEIADAIVDELPWKRYVVICGWL